MFYTLKSVYFRPTQINKVLQFQASSGFEFASTSLSKPQTCRSVFNTRTFALCCWLLLDTTALFLQGSEFVQIQPE
jgi:hypothetical protein